MNKPTVAIYLYNRLFDPLIQSNFWLYIKDYLNDASSPVRFHLITYEDPSFPLTTEQQALVADWKSRGLEWTALTWHPGMSLKQKGTDLLSGLMLLGKLRLQGIRHVMTLGSVAGTFAYLCASVLRMRLFLYQYEPHSEYSVDNGMWARSSLQYKISQLLERRAARFASVVASGTKFMQERLQQVWQSKASFVKIPTVANDKKFLFDQGLRDVVRDELGLAPDTYLLFYPGKFGGLYYQKETALMFRWLHELEPRLHFLIVTPHADAEVIELFDQAGVDRTAYTIRHSDYADIHRYYFGADFAVIAVPPGLSKKFVSNIKVGEYLLAGLPYLITRGVSEDYLFADENDVGVVVDDFNEPEIKAAWPKIQKYLQRDPQERRAHCREKGLGYRGFETLNPRFRQAVSILVSK